MASPRRAPDAADPPWFPWPGRVRTQLQTLSQLPFNFDTERLSEVSGDPWLVDDYTRPLPAEAPGDPVEHGPFERAARLLADYDFTDRRQVRAFYRSADDLEGRDMLLEVRFLFVRLRIGVRVGNLVDEPREIEGRPVRAWGVGYGTLRGHLERGWIDYEIWKWLDSGEVEFKIRAVSRIAEIRNPVTRAGFSVVGRREQIRFARRCGERMETLVKRGLAGGPEGLPPPQPADGIHRSPAR